MISVPEGAIKYKIDENAYFKRRSLPSPSNYLSGEAEFENNEVQSKYNFTNSASKLLKNCQGVLSKKGKF